MTINTNHRNFFDLFKAPAGTEWRPFKRWRMSNDSLTGHSNYSSGHVVRPDKTVSVVNNGGTVNVTDSHDTIKY